MVTTMKNPMKIIADAVSGSDLSDLDVATDAHRAAQKKVADLAARSERLAHELSAERSKLADLALAADLSGDRTAYDRQAATVDKIEKDLRLTDDAQVAAGAKVKEAFAKIAELTQGRTLSTFKKLTTASQKDADELASLLAQVTDTYKRLVTSRERIRRAWPTGIPPIGLHLDAGSLKRLVELELFRLNPLNLLEAGAAAALPGAHSGLLIGPASDIKPMVEVIAQSNAALLDKIKSGATLGPSQPVASPTSQPDPDADVLAVVPAPTLSAAEIMASMPPLKRVTLDKNGREK